MVWLDRLGVASLVSSHPLPVQPHTQAVHRRNVSLAVWVQATSSGEHLVV